MNKNSEEKDTGNCNNLKRFQLTLVSSKISKMPLKLSMSPNEKVMRNLELINAQLRRWKITTNLITFNKIF